MIRRLRAAYAAYNLLQYRALARNAALYRKYGLRKPYFAGVAAADFSVLGAAAAAEPPRQTTLEEVPFYGRQTADVQRSIRDFDRTGYCIIPGFWDAARVAAVNTEIERLLRDGTVKYRYGNKLMFAIRKSEVLQQACAHGGLGGLLDHLIRGEARLFQSINFLRGSEQRTHSDSIHMTTYPAGGLLGVWIALEDVDADNGPVHYYPGSHHWPYYTNADFGNAGGRFLLGRAGYPAYEAFIAERLAESPLEKQIFRARAGDLLIWHANLLHGGEPHHDPARSRKSMVLHYFDANRICYHEITERPALL